MLGRDTRRAVVVAIGTFAIFGSRSMANDPPDVGIDQKLGQQVPLELTFFDEAGQPVNLADLLDGKPAVLALVYYKCPMLCGQVLNGLLAGLGKLEFNVGKQFNVLTVSIDPDETSALAASKKLKYIAHYDRPGTEQGWHFLTGKAESITQLAEAVGFRYSFDPQTQQFAHAAGIMILTPDGRIARYFYGIEYPERDLRLGLVEASAGSIGSPADQLLLLCYAYDPTTGRYGLAIMNTLRIAGVATVVVMAMLIYLLSRRNRRMAIIESVVAADRQHGTEGPPNAGGTGR